MEPASNVSAQVRSFTWLAGMLAGMWAGGVPGLIVLAGGVPSGLDGLDRGLARFLGFAP